MSKPTDILDPPPLPTTDSFNSGSQSPQQEIDTTSVLVLLPSPESDPQLRPFLPHDQDPTSSQDHISSSTAITATDSDNSSLSDNNEDDFLVNEDGYVYGGMEIDSERDVDLDEEHIMQMARLKSSAVPPLPPSKVFLYLLSPFLKLGAILAISFPPPSAEPVHPGPDDHESETQRYHTRLGNRKHEVLGLLAFAILGAFTRQVWYMLARYIRRADLEEIILESFIRGQQSSSRQRRSGAVRKREKEVLRKWVRYTVRSCVGAFRLLVVVVYLRVCVDILLPLLPSTLLLVSSRIPVTLFLSLVLSPLCLARSLGSPAVIYTSWISIATFSIWIICTIYARLKGIFIHGSEAGESLGVFWQGLTLYAFAFATSTTLPLYASLRSTLQPGTQKPNRSHSFKILSLVSVIVAVCLIVPGLLVSGVRSPAPPTPSSPTHPLQIFMSLLASTTLALCIPVILITTPKISVPQPLRRFTKSFPVSRLVVYVVTIGLALAGQGVVSVVSDLVMVLAFASGFIVPAITHIVIHNFRRPLSIVIPPTTPTPITPSRSESARTDELLQRKERTMQRRRLGKRIGWDVAVWVLLVPTGVGGIIWSIGRLGGKF